MKLRIFFTLVTLTALTLFIAGVWSPNDLAIGERYAATGGIVIGGGLILSITWAE